MSDLLLNQLFAHLGIIKQHKVLMNWLMLLQALNGAALLHGSDIRPSEEEVRSVEEERIQVLNNIEELEQKIKELDNQIEESAREVKRNKTDAKFHLKNAILLTKTARIIAVLFTCFDKITFYLQGGG